MPRSTMPWMKTYLCLLNDRNYVRLTAAQRGVMHDACMIARREDDTDTTGQLTGRIGTIQELATESRLSLKVIHAALPALAHFITNDNGILYRRNFDKYQGTSLEIRREQNRKAQARQRDKQSANQQTISDESANNQQTISVLDVDVDVDKEKDVRLPQSSTKEKTVEDCSSTPALPEIDRCPYSEIQKWWNETAAKHGLPTVRIFERHKRRAKVVWGEWVKHGEPADIMRQIDEAIGRSEFLRHGGPDRPWRLNLTTLLRPGFWGRVLDCEFEHGEGESLRSEIENLFAKGNK